MIRNVTLAAVVAAFAVTPALAASYYVAHAPSSKKCEVTEVKPDGKKMIEVGTYTSRSDADKAMKSESACK